MQQRELVSGFSDLKNILIRTYKIDRDRELVKLYFTERDSELLMHDYDDHKKVICLCTNLKNKFIRNDLVSKARLLVEESLMQANPAQFLNLEFQLNGFFRF